MSNGPAPSSSTVTVLLRRWSSGDDPSAEEQVMQLVYAELHRLAHGAMVRERGNHTLQTTALVHEAFMRLVEADVDWQDRKHFYSIAARSMRRILVDHARSKSRKKRGDGARVVELDEDAVAAATRGPDLLGLDEALRALAELDSRKAKAVELHYFGGLSYDEVANVLDVSAATVHRDLRLAKAWLLKHAEAE